VKFESVPSEIMEIPAYTQKLNKEFLSRKRGIHTQISYSELLDLCQSCEIITRNNCVKFQSIPRSSYGDISLYAAKNLTKNFKVERGA
jgi:hypothetical protein